MELKASIYPCLVLILSFLVVALLADQQQPLHHDLSKPVAQPEPPKVEYPKASDGILTIHTDSSRNWFTLDKGLPITFVIKNTTNKVIKLETANGWPLVDFVVLNSKHEKMPLTRYGQSILNRGKFKDFYVLNAHFIISIKPGEEFKERTLLNQQFDMTEGGEYTISGSKTVIIGNAPMTLESNVIKIEDDGFDSELPPGVLSDKELRFQSEQSHHYYDPNLMQLKK